MKKYIEKPFDIELAKAITSGNTWHEAANAAIEAAQEILEKVDEQIITEVLSKQPKKVIALDRIFKGNDQLKTNTALQMKDAGVEFKTI